MSETVSSLSATVAPGSRTCPRDILAVDVDAKEADENWFTARAVPHPTQVELGIGQTVEYSRRR